MLLGALGLTAVLASLVQPYMPSLTRKILAQMNLDWDEVRGVGRGADWVWLCCKRDCVFRKL